METKSHICSGLKKEILRVKKHDSFDRKAIVNPHRGLSAVSPMFFGLPVRISVPSSQQHGAKVKLSTKRAINRQQ